MRRLSVPAIQVSSVGAWVVLVCAAVACAAPPEAAAQPATRVAQFSAADRLGTTAYSSVRDEELARFLCGTNGIQGSVNYRCAERCSSLLSAIPLPSATNTACEAIKLVLGRMRECDESGILPVWTGTAWMDGMPLAVNGYRVPADIHDRLFRVNLLERSCGTFFWSENERRQRSPFSGFHPFLRYMSSRTAMLDAGYELKFDRTFGIWRITGTNAPPQVTRSLRRDTDFNGF